MFTLIPMIRSLILVVAPLATLAAPALAIDPLPTCQKAKLNAIATATRRVFTCSRADLGNGVTISSFPERCVRPVSSRFPLAWNKAIEAAAKKGQSCFNAPNWETVGLGVAAAARSAGAEIQAGFAPSDDANPDAVEAMNKLMKAAETYLLKTLKIESAELARPNAAKRAAARIKALGQLEKSFARESARLEQKNVVFSGNADDVAATIDSFAVGTANAIRTNPILELGRLVDSGVAGVEFLPALDAAGGSLTLRGGYFPITAGSMSFWIGSIALGTGDPAAGRDLTVVDLSGAAGAFAAGATNRARFLQTLDDDENPRNGINILPCTRDAADVAVDFDQSIASFGSDQTVLDQVEALTACTRSGPRDLVSVEAAQEHLCQDIVLPGMAGAYEGTFHGDDFGAWEGKFSSTGRLSAVGTSYEAGRFTMRGEASCNGSFIGRATTGASFRGTNVNGIVEGSWINAGNSGTFFGEKKTD